MCNQLSELVLQIFVFLHFTIKHFHFFLECQRIPECTNPFLEALKSGCIEHHYNILFILTKVAMLVARIVFLKAQFLVTLWPGLQSNLLALQRHHIK